MERELSRVKVLSLLALIGGSGGVASGDISLMQLSGIVALVGGALALRHKVIFGQNNKSQKQKRKSAKKIVENNDISGDTSGATSGAVISAKPAKKRKKRGILLGINKESGEDYYWDVDNLPTKSSITYGRSGFGKTYTMLKIILGIKEHYGKGGILIDLKPSFSDSDMQKEPDFLEKMPVAPQNYLAREPLNVNVFKGINKTLGVGDQAFVYKEDNSKIGDRVAGIFADVYEMSADQFSTLSLCIEDGLNAYGKSFDLAKMLEMLKEEEVDEDGNSKGEVYQHASFITTKIRPFVKAGTNGLFDNGDSGWSEMFDSRMLEVIQFDAITSEPVKRVATEFILESLKSHIMQNGHYNDVSPIYFPECHHASFEKGSPMSTILGEARSKGGFVLLDTQSTTKFGKNKKEAIGLIDSGCSTTFYFKPTREDTDTFARSLALSDGSKSFNRWATILSGLKLGECVIDSGGSVEVVKINAI